MRNIDSMIGRQIGEWQAKHPGWKPEAEAEGPHEQAQPVVALAPQLGAGGRRVCEILSARMGYDVLGTRLIDKVAENMDVRRALIDRMDQRLRSYTRTLVEGLLAGRHVEQREYFRHLLDVLELFVVEGRCILIGRGAPSVVGPGQGVRVRLTASHTTRIANMRQWYGLGEAEAQERIETSDRERAEFCRTFFDKDIDERENYDLTINLDYIDAETAADLIQWHVRVVANRTMPWESSVDPIRRRIEALRDLQGEGREAASRRPVVAFSNLFCSGVRLVAQEIAQRTGFEIYGYRLVDRVAEQLEISPRAIDRLDHRARSALQAAIEGMVMGQRVSREDYEKTLRIVVRQLIEEGGVVLIGRGSPFLLEASEGLRVCVVAPFEKRLENVKAFYGVEGEAAEEFLRQADRDRQEYMHQYFGADIARLGLFDLSINMERVEAGLAADFILYALRGQVG